MDRFLKIQDIVQAVLFGTIGVFALGAALFWGKTHQFGPAALCALMVWCAIAEIRQEERRARERSVNN